MTPVRRTVLPLVFIAVTVIGGTLLQLSSMADGMLRPTRGALRQQMPQHCVDSRFAGAGVELRGWECRAEGPRKGALVYLHGVSANRGRAIGIAARFVSKGFDVIAYDSRAHGLSEGEMCTYGYFEKSDLRKVIDTLAPGPIVLMGSSMGAAVALQEAADDPRVTAVISVETFADLRSAARDRVPSLMPDILLDVGFLIAEWRGAFQADAVSPVNAAKQLRMPVLLIHGAADNRTPPSHSERVLAALAGPKQLILVEGARHGGSLRGPDVWPKIDRWLEDVLDRHVEHGFAGLPHSVTTTVVSHR
jgi:alpha-beta hydrolase superfamily lysophospholipase